MLPFLSFPSSSLTLLSVMPFGLAFLFLFKKGAMLEIQFYVLTVSIVIVMAICAVNLNSIYAGEIAYARYIFYVGVFLMLSVYYMEKITDINFIWREVKHIQLICLVLVFAFYVKRDFFLVEMFKARSAYEINSFHYDRWSGVFGFPGDYGNFLCFMLLVYITVTAKERIKYSDLLVGLMAFVSLYFTESRNGLVLLVYCLVMYLFLRPSKRVLIYCALAVLPIIVALTVFNLDYVARILVFEEFVEGQSRFFEWDVFLREKFNINLPVRLASETSLSDFPFIESEFIRQYMLLGPFFVFGYFALLLYSIFLMALSKSESKYSQVFLVSGVYMFTNLTFCIFFNAVISRPKLGILFLFCVLSGVVGVYQYYKIRKLDKSKMIQHKLMSN